MKAESAVRPRDYNVDKVGDLAHISIFDNIKKVTKIVDETKQEVYEYDYLVIKIPFRKGLDQEIKLNFNDWLELAREKENNQPEPDELKEIVKQQDKALVELAQMINDSELAMIEIVNLMLGGI